MLVIARKVGQTVLIGDEIEITVSSVRGDLVRLAIQAPRAISIFRKEAVEQVELGNAAAVNAAAGWLDLLTDLPEPGNPATPPPAADSP
jgi:carbon storage regulator